MLAIKKLNKTINGKKILQDISFSVKNGEIAVFLGESGVGKSTLLRALNNLEVIDSGEIYLDQKKFDFRTVHKQHIIGMVFQQFNLFDHMTVEENIAFALEKVMNVTKNNAH